MKENGRGNERGGRREGIRERRVEVGEYERERSWSWPH